MNAFLKEDVYSYFRQGKKTPALYGKKGDKVKIISQSGHVLIVQPQSGPRFPVENKSLIHTK